MNAVASLLIKNLWHNPQSAYSHPEYCINTKPVFRHRGVEVFRIPAGGYLHVLAGVAITHRVGVDKSGTVIDALLDGTSDVWCCDAVAAHLRSHGFTPKAYSDPEEQ